MNNRYSYGKRKPTGPDTLAVILIAIGLFIISLGVLYMNVKTETEILYQELQSAQTEIQSLRMSIDSLRTKPAPKAEAKKDAPALYFKKRQSKEGEKKHEDAHPEIIEIPIAPTTTQDTAR